MNKPIVSIIRVAYMQTWIIIFSTFDSWIIILLIINFIMAKHPNCRNNHFEKCEK